MVAGGGAGAFLLSHGAPLAAALLRPVPAGVVRQTSVEQLDEHWRCRCGGPAGVLDLLVRAGGGGGGAGEGEVLGGLAVQ